MSTTQTTQTTTGSNSRYARLEESIHKLLSNEIHTHTILKWSAVFGASGFVGYLFAATLAVSGYGTMATVVWSIGVISMTTFVLLCLFAVGLTITIRFN